MNQNRKKHMKSLVVVPEEAGIELAATRSGESINYLETRIAYEDCSRSAT